MSADVEQGPVIEQPVVEVPEVPTAANLANSVTAIYGISGSGKSSLADTGAEYAWEQFGKITLCYVADLGGFGNKRLSLIRAGIMRVWDPRNHVDAFATMEMMSHGAFPETLIDPETGYAAPDVKLVLPRRKVYTLVCPQGHDVRRDENQAVFRSATFPCPTCGIQTNMSNAKAVRQTQVRHRMFEKVGLRIYDSFTALNAWGLDDLQKQSAAGSLPTNSTGGSALAGADALYSGGFRYSTGSKPQYGFMQSRTYGWLSNVKTIPDQIVPAIATFLVESTAGGDDTGGEPVYGLKIAGSAKTAEAASWVGNLLHATKEPNIDGVMVHRLWLGNHVDPRDPRRIPYLAKHRGTPLDMPPYLEDAPGTPAWSGCSLAVFFRLLNEQLIKIEAARAARYPNAPGIWAGERGDDVDEVVGVAAGTAVTGATASPPGTAGTGLAGPALPRPLTGGARTLRRPGAVAHAPVAPPAASQGPAVASPPVVTSTVAPAQVSAATPPSGEASSAPVAPVQGSTAPVPAVEGTPVAVTPEIKTAGVVFSPLTIPAQEAAVPNLPPPPASPTPPVAPAPAVTGVPSPGARPLRRVARPPVG